MLLTHDIVLAQKYKISMKPTGMYQSLWELIKINFICHFYSMFLTAAIGQIVIRWHLSTKNNDGRMKFIAIMVLERSTFFFILLLVLIVSMKASTHPFTILFFNTLYPLVYAGTLCLIIFFFILNSPFIINWIKKAFGALNKINEKILIKFNTLADSFSVFSGKWDIFSTNLFLSVIWQLIFIIRVYLLILSLSIPLDFLTISWMASSVLLFQMLPISFNGIGIREAAYTFLFGMFNISPDKGVLIGILLFSQILFLSIVGGLFHLSSRR